jgi:hypothetical protein
MSAIWRSLPFFANPTVAAVATGEVVTIRPFQIVVWVSITPHRWRALPPTAGRFPAVLDTGHSHNFSIRRGHLESWARVATESLRHPAHVRVNRVRIPLLAANVWLHPNQSGQRDRFADTLPFRLDLSPGIAVYPPGTPGEPRLPLLGLRGLVQNDLHLTIDGKNRRVALRTARRFWLF